MSPLSYGLVTGASSGIGLELARIHAKNGQNRILVARNEKVLQQIKRELTTSYHVNVELIVEDLSKPQAAQRIFEKTISEGWQVDYLFNNAGFGGLGRFSTQDIHNEQEMNAVNMLAVHELMHLFLPGMLSKGEGFILNTASTAGFLPGPMQANYFATKAYVVSLTQSVAFEWRNSGVKISALCPGPVKTNFGDRAGMTHLKAFEKATSAEWIAKVAYQKMLRGEVIIIPELGFRWSIRFLLPFLPTRLLMRVIEYMQSVPQRRSL
jgi:short-subunit dehydrogenase